MSATGQIPTSVVNTSKTGNGLRVSRSILSFPAAIGAILVAKAFWTCRDRLADPDLGWHLRNGQHILDNWHFPLFDSYSFTAAGSRWLDHSWLPEVVFYSAYRVLGLMGVFVVFFLAIAALLVFVFSLCMKRAVDPLAAAIVTICGGLLAMVGFTPRPQIFAWLCFVGIFALLLRFREDTKSPLWPIPLLFCLWINCHGSWSLGLATFGIVFGAGLIKKDIGSLTSAAWERSESRQLTLTFGLSIAALFVNPFGWRLVLYPFDLAFRQKLNVGMISEWASVDFNDARGIYVIVALAAVLTLALLPRRPWRIDDALLVAFALFCGLKHIRFLVFTGIVLPPLVVPQIGPLSSYDPKHQRYVLNGVIVSAVLGILVFAFPSNRALQTQVDGFFPSNALNYIRAHHLAGKLFNEYEWGGYLEWQAPELKVFVDSRADIFEHNGVLRDYVGIVNVYGSQELLDHYRIDSVLFSSDSPLAYFLSTRRQWECVYKDNQAVVYRRVQR